MKTLILLIIIVFSFSSELFSQTNTGLEMVSNEEIIVYKYILSELPLLVDLPVKRFPFNIHDGNKEELGISIPYYTKYCDTCNYIIFVYHLSGKVNLSRFDSSNTFDSIVLENAWNQRRAEYNAKIPFFYLCSGNFSYITIDSIKYVPIIRNSNSYFLGVMMFSRVLFNNSGDIAFVGIYSFYTQKAYKFFLKKGNDKWRIVKYDSHNVLF